MGSHGHNHAHLSYNIGDHAYNHDHQHQNLNHDPYHYDRRERNRYVNGADEYLHTNHDNNWPDHNQNGKDWYDHIHYDHHNHEGGQKGSYHNYDNSHGHDYQNYGNNQEHDSYNYGHHGEETWQNRKRGKREWRLNGVVGDNGRYRKRDTSNEHGEFFHGLSPEARFPHVCDSI